MGGVRFDRCVLLAKKSPGVLDSASLLREWPRALSAPVRFCEKGFRYCTPRTAAPASVLQPAADMRCCKQALLQVSATPSKRCFKKALLQAREQALLLLLLLLLLLQERAPLPPRS